jgi:hypothetical protein
MLMAKLTDRIPFRKIVGLAGMGLIIAGAILTLGA